MKETVAGDHARVRLDPPEGARDGLAALDAVLAGRSQIVWGEHCSECAYPSCYSACAFYTPRADLNCRRFEGGIEAVQGGPGVRELRRIRFRRWGKLEGRGPAAMRPPAAAHRREALDGAVSRAIGAGALPLAVGRKLAWSWNAAKGRAAAPGLAADAFVVECWSADGATHPFTLTVLEQDEGGHGRMFQARFDAAPAYGRRVIPVAEIAAAVDLTASYLVQIEPVGEAQGRAVVFGLTDFVALTGALAEVTPPRPAAAASAQPPLAKVVVWDLDETLWTGTLAEDGVTGVRPRPEAVEAVAALDARGVLQSVASKNDPAEALAALTAHGLADYFLHPQVGWGPKSEAVGRIARALDLGLDSFVFVDDQPFERGEVTAAHPAVRVLPHTAVPGLAAHPWFDHPLTAESGRRRAMYQAEAQRAAAFDQGDSVTDYAAFLRGCGIELDAWGLGAADVARVHELSQRTNQLNFTGAKLSREEVERLARPDPAHARLVLRCTDRFGDYGVIGFVDLDLRAGEVALFFVSCRVQRKRVEHALFADLAARLAALGHAEMRVAFRLTERNSAAVTMLAELGFTASADGTSWSRPTATPFPDADVVRLSARELEAA